MQSSYCMRMSIKYWVMALSFRFSCGSLRKPCKRDITSVAQSQWFLMSVWCHHSSHPLQSVCRGALGACRHSNKRTTIQWWQNETVSVYFGFHNLVLFTKLCLDNMNYIGEFYIIVFVICMGSRQIIINYARFVSFLHYTQLNKLSIVIVHICMGGCRCRLGWICCSEKVTLSWFWVLDSCHYLQPPGSNSSSAEKQWRITQTLKIYDMIHYKTQVKCACWNIFLFWQQTQRNLLCHPSDSSLLNQFTKRLFRFVHWFSDHFYRLKTFTLAGSLSFVVRVYIINFIELIH